MPPLSADYLAKLRFDAQQLLTLRTLCEYRDKPQLLGRQPSEVWRSLRQVAVVKFSELQNRLECAAAAAHRLKPLVLKRATLQTQSEQAEVIYSDALSLTYGSGQMLYIELLRPFEKFEERMGTIERALGAKCGRLALKCSSANGPILRQSVPASAAI